MTVLIWFSPRLARLHGRLVLELAEVHELAHGRTGVGGDLDQVEVGLGGQPKGVLDAHDADLLAVGADQPDLGDPDAVVDAGLADVVLLVVERVTRDNEKGSRRRLQLGASHRFR